VIVVDYFYGASFYGHGDVTNGASSYGASVHMSSQMKSKSVSYSSDVGAWYDHDLDLFHGSCPSCQPDAPVYQFSPFTLVFVQPFVLSQQC
jgi:hypothetical protein